MKKNAKVAVGVGAGLAAAGLAAYLLTGKRGTKNRAKLKQWSSKIQREVSAELKKLKNVTKEDYLRVISNVIDRYEQLHEEESPARTTKKRASTKRKSKTKK